MSKRLLAFSYTLILCLLITSLAIPAELRKLGEYDLSWGPYGTTWTSTGRKSVRYIPRYFDNNAFADNLSLFGKSVTGDGSGSVMGYNIPLYLSNTLSVNDAITTCTDVRYYGAAGDNTTDDTAAIQAAIDNSTGCVYFPSGIYEISSSLNLKTATEYRGPLGGTFYTGMEHPASGYGAALRWAGAANGTMVNMEGTWNATWSGIDLDGGVYTDNVTGIRIHSDNDPTSQRNVITNFRMYNLGYGIIVGGLPSTSYAYQADGWTVEKFAMYMVGTGIYINGGNANQYSTVRNGSIAMYDSGIYIYEGAYQNIETVTFASLQAPGATSANITLRLPRIIKIERTQGEPAVGAIWDHIRLTTGATMYPVTLSNNYFDGSLVVANSSDLQNIISIGNTYDDNVLISGNTVLFTSIGDHYSNNGFGSVGIVDSGTNNSIMEMHNYYDNTTPTHVTYKRYYNQVLMENTTTGGIEFKTGLATLTADNTTPSVSGGSLFQTGNTTPTTITNFLGGVEGQRITVQSLDSNTTIDFSGGPLRGNVGVDLNMTIGDWLECTKIGDYWYCLVGDWS